MPGSEGDPGSSGSRPATEVLKDVSAYLQSRAGSSPPPDRSSPEWQAAFREFNEAFRPLLFQAWGEHFQKMTALDNRLRQVEQAEGDVLTAIKKDWSTYMKGQDPLGNDLFLPNVQKAMGRLLDNAVGRKISVDALNKRMKVLINANHMLAEMPKGDHYSRVESVLLSSIVSGKIDDKALAEIQDGLANPKHQQAVTQSRVASKEAAL